MSAEAVAWAYKIHITHEHPTDPTKSLTLKMAPKFLLVTLANYADEEHSAFPSFATLATRMSCSRSTVIEAANKLEELGLVTIKKRRRENRSHTSSRYYLPVDNWAPFVIIDDTPSPESGLGSPEPAVDNSPDPGPESGPAQSRIRTPLNRQPNRREGLNSGPVPNSTTDAKALGRGTGQRVTPRMVSDTLGKPLSLIRVREALSPQLDGISEQALGRVANRILGKGRRRQPIGDETAYVIHALRNPDDGLEWLSEILGLDWNLPPATGQGAF